MNPEIIGQIILTSLQIFKIILEDIPKERREQAWKDWYIFIDSLKLKG